MKEHLMQTHGFADQCMAEDCLEGMKAIPYFVFGFVEIGQYSFKAKGIFDIKANTDIKIKGQSRVFL